MEERTCRLAEVVGPGVAAGEGQGLGVDNLCLQQLDIRSQLLSGVPLVLVAVSDQDLFGERPFVAGELSPARATTFGAGAPPWPARTAARQAIEAPWEKPR